MVALAWQQEPTKTHETVVELFDRAYARGENTSAAETVAAAGQAMGLPGAEEWAASDEGALEVLKDDDQAKRMGITGVPAFLISSGGSKAYLLSGAQPPEVFVEVFQKVLSEGRGGGSE
jgi:predicted DsbA family dithiol-disulfide isomerase